jgi:hypothetical protein
MQNNNKQKLKSTKIKPKQNNPQIPKQKINNKTQKS